MAGSLSARAGALRRKALDGAKKVVPVDARVRLVYGRLALRTRTARWRGLPDVLVLGAMRSGTSSLYKYLGYHPDIAPSLRKEVEYFTRHVDKGSGWYRAHYPLASRDVARRVVGKPPLVTFEASPYYLAHPLAPERAHAVVPEAKLIVMLRNPVDRAFSHWQHMVRHDIESLSFEDAIAAEEERLAPEVARMADDPSYFSLTHYHFSYQERSRYGEQLERWLAHYPAERFALVDSDAFYADVAGVYDQILGFMGVAPFTLDRFDNYSYLGASYGPATSKLSDATRSRLDEVFAADQALLARLGEPLRHLPGG
ncbi:MAG: sulfotransferase [Acidimicrobiales bacterium]|nr:sulfotransferase [Acidimicrobiales bacterium]